MTSLNTHFSDSLLLGPSRWGNKMEDKLTKYTHVHVCRVNMRLRGSSSAQSEWILHLPGLFPAGFGPQCRCHTSPLTYHSPATVSFHNRCSRLDCKPLHARKQTIVALPCVISHFIHICFFNFTSFHIFSTLQPQGAIERSNLSM